MSRKTKDFIIRAILLFCALSSLVFLGGIVLVLITQGIPIVKTVGISEFLFGTHWYPTHDDAEFGILPMIYGSLIITAGALIFAAPLSILSALFLAEIAPFWLREAIKPVIELLAGIPSVIYGLFGAIFIAPIVQKAFNIPTGLTAFSAALILGIMVLPTVTSIVDRLERKGVVTRRRTPSDRRRVIVSPTDAAYRILQSNPSLLQDHFIARFNQLERWEQTSMLAVLQRIASMMGATHIETTPHLFGDVSAAADAEPAESTSTSIET